MKTKELLRELARAGAEVVRQKGDHRLFRLKTGAMVTVAVAGAHTEASDGQVAAVRRALSGRPSGRSLGRKR
jgi:predicted RNA binding protein YcfA (HicA-like mRNA interferase family)